MVIDALADWWVHQVGVEPFKGTSGYGKTTYGPVQVVQGFVDDKRRLVRDGNGDQVIAESTLALPRDAPVLPLGSRVTLPGVFGARVTTVLASSIGDTGGFLADLEHAEYALA